MKSFAILALLSSLVSASSGGKKTMGTSSSPTIGAAYFLTNDPSGNYIVSAAIGANGKLTLRQATPAQGAGNHGGPGNGADPLFSQGAVTASAAGNIVAAVNAGSNTISVFTIDPKDPTNLDIIGYPISSGGEFPISVAINKAGNTVCALTGGAVNGVACFAVDTKKRTVQPIANTARSLKLNQTTPANGPPGTASHLIFSEDNKQLIASVKGVPPTPGMLAVWDVASDGSLSPQFKAIAPPNGGVLPFGLTIIPGKNALLSADPGVGLEIFDLSSTTSKSSRASSLAIAGQAAVCWSTFSPKTGSYFVIDAGNGMVSEIALQSSTLKPTVVKQYFQGNGTTPIDGEVATVGAKDFLYVLASSATQIKVMALGTPGKATALQTVDIAGPAKRAGLTIHGPNLQGMATFLKRA